MNIKIKAAIVCGIVAAALSLGAFTAYANPFQFVPTTQFATATTTRQYIITGGNSTTTTFDAFAQGQPKAIDKGVLGVQMEASSTSSVLNVALQYSNDGIDWYSDQLLSTTTTMDISVANSYKWTAINTATTSKMVNVQFPTRYVRAIFSEAGAGAAIWWQFTPQRQSN